MEVVFGLGFCDSLPSFDEFVESLIGTDFKDNINIGLILEKVMEFDNIIWFESSMDFDLGVELIYIMVTFSRALLLVSDAF